MLFASDSAPAVRLAYCTNLHPAADLEELLDGLRRLAVPLRRRLAPESRFGVGLWLARPLAEHLACAAGESELDRLAAFLEREGLDAFTYNAFPIGDFHRAGLKRDVFRPTWAEEARLAYTLDVARVAARLAARSTSERIAISTHAGGFGDDLASAVARQAAARNLARCALEFAALSATCGKQFVLALEAEPRSHANDSSALAAWFAELLPTALATLAPRLDLSREEAENLLRRHLGWCLDACHSAVEGEQAEEALGAVRASGFAFGKLQYSNALTVASPATNEAGVRALRALAEPRYLHQVTALDEHGRATLRATDLDELAGALDSAAGEAWRAAREWRCHFHVPVDREALGAGLTTTRAHAAALLEECLGGALGGGELHVEIETYTWDVLPASARSADLLDDLEREVRDVARRITASGRQPVSEPAPEHRKPPSAR